MSKITPEQFVNEKLGDKNYTHSKYPMYRKEISDWIKEYATLERSHIKEARSADLIEDDDDDKHYFIDGSYKGNYFSCEFYENGEVVITKKLKDKDSQIYSRFLNEQQQEKEQLEKSYIAGYKERARMSKLIFDHVSIDFAKSKFRNWYKKHNNG